VQGHDLPESADGRRVQVRRRVQREDGQRPDRREVAMLGTALIVFREVLEAALIIGIAAAATRGIANRGRFIAAGIAAGIVGSALVAGGAEAISSLAEGMGQELFNASILGIAVAMLAWHNIWMSQHGRTLAANARSL